MRQTLTWLAEMPPCGTLDALLATVDWRGVTPRQVSAAVLGRVPHEVAGAAFATSFDPPAYCRALLLGREFQAAVVPNVLAAFPEKRRRFFVHIPRCGGTSLEATLVTRTCVIPHNTLGSGWSDGQTFLDRLAAVCRAVPRHDAIHVSGHFTLRWLVDQRLARFGDSVWASVRQPEALILSLANHILTVLDADPDRTRPDARHWGAALGLRGPAADLPRVALRRTFDRMLRGGLLPTDALCHFLGDGTAASARDLLAATDAEVIPAARLDDWHAARFPGAAPVRRNTSRPFFKWDALDAAERRHVSDRIRQDAPLHRAIEAAMGGAISASGLSLARPAATPLPAKARGRAGRAARPLLLDPLFLRLPGAPGGGALGGAVGWADPPLDFRTVETTLRLPVIDARIRVRYRRRAPPPTAAARRSWRLRVRAVIAVVVALFAKSA